MLCGDCPTCLEHTARVIMIPARHGKTTAMGPLPTVERLEKHAKRFGSFMVRETAAEYGLTVDVAEPPKKKKWRR